ncbi:transporter substrate-binding domain-containing protein [Shewanella sp. UCD-KL12]|uniref:transporter substrate-binding domain-containing protein n=1 Tax=Shewanella sp. UCD-KL12 TaxID=1917163 RepID=UPI0009FB08CC|nr:transporter substrate-binding domain-containing protein [Shewanella sp. UCD-KL12]
MTQLSSITLIKPLPSRSLFTALVFAICLLSLPVSANDQLNETKANNQLLYTQINTRLGYMKAVARYKWQHQIPIEVLERDRLVLDKSMAMAKEYGLNPVEVEQFFKVQIALAKKIQRHYHQQWQQEEESQQLNNQNKQAQGSQSKAPTLAEIRPQLISLGREIIASIASHQGEHDFSLLNESLSSPALDINDKAQVFAALTSINPLQYPSQLDRITAQKILYVGTTGDYEPFSFYKTPISEETSHQVTGIDIDLAKHLAHSLGAQAVFLPTSWHSMLDDLATYKYDIMMSGISKKLFRQQQGLMSDIYLEDGKTPIARCEQVTKFSSLAKIDKASTRIIVNKGGTNQKFVDAHIQQAKVTVHDSNVTIFDEIIAKRADVMITDKIEVQLQMSKHPELCATMPEETLSYSSKAYLMPRDIIWKEYVDTWLELAIKDGTVDKAFKRFVQ